MNNVNTTEKERVLNLDFKGDNTKTKLIEKLLDKLSKLLNLKQELILESMLKDLEKPQNVQDLKT